ncbi:MAG: hypothetical protein AAF614_40035 [Chloroflexota bacterium]
MHMIPLVLVASNAVGAGNIHALNSQNGSASSSQAAPSQASPRMLAPPTIQSRYESLRKEMLTEASQNSDSEDDPIKASRIKDLQEATRLLQEIEERVFQLNNIPTFSDSDPSLPASTNDELHNRGKELLDQLETYFTTDQFTEIAKTYLAEDRGSR